MLSRGAKKLTEDETLTRHQIEEWIRIALFLDDLNEARKRREPRA